MNTKNILSILCILSILVLTFGLVSSLSIVGVTPSPSNIYFNSTSATLTFKINNTDPSFNATNINAWATVSGASGNVSLSPSTLTVLTANETSSTISGTVYLSMIGERTVTVTLNANASVNGTSTSTSTTTSYNVRNNACPSGEVGSLEISDFSMDNSGEGTDDEWQPLDSVDIEVEVKNPSSSSISGVSVRLYVLDANNTDVTDDFDFDDDEIRLGTIQDDDYKTATFKVTSLSSKIDEGDYKLVLKVFKDGSETTQCTSSSSSLSNNIFEAISVSKEDAGVVLNQKELTTIEASCGDPVSYSFNVYNTGSDKQDSVLVKIFNKDLKIDEYQQIGSMRSDEDSQITFDFTIPSNFSKTVATIYVTTYFDYDDGDVLELNSYDSNSDEDLDKVFGIPVKITNCQQSTASTATIAAGLASGTETQVGENLVIQTVITNAGTSASTYTFGIAGYETWADLVSIEPQTATIAAGNSNTATITLKPKVEGVKSLKITATANGKTTEQVVQVSIDSNQGIIASMKDTLGTVGFWLVVAIAALIIVIILVLVIKLIVGGSKAAASEF